MSLAASLWGKPLTGHTSTVSSVTFSSDNQILATGSYDKTVILWDVASRKPVGEPLKGHSSLVSSWAFSPDDKTLASGSYDGTVILWDVASRKPLGGPLRSYSAAVSSIAFNPHGKILAAASDTTVILWEVANRKPLGEPLDGRSTLVSSIAFSPDGKTLAAAGGADRAAILWDTNMDVESWKNHICEIVNRNFSQAEWEEQMGKRPYRKVCAKLPGPSDADRQSP